MAEEDQVQDEAVEQAEDEGSLEDQLLEGQDIEEEAVDQGGDDGSAELPEHDADATEGQQETDFDLVSTLQQLGFQDVNDPVEAQRRLVEAYAYTAQQAAALQEQARRAQELATYGELYLQQQQQQQGQQQTAQPSKTDQQQQEAQGTERWWNPPKIDENEIRRWQTVTIGEDGQPQVTWREDTPAEIKLNAQKYSDYVEKWTEDLIHRPHEVLPKIIEAEFDRLFEDRWNQRQQEAKVKTLAEQIKENNADWMYARDPVTGGLMQDPNTGEPVLSEEGTKMMQLVYQVAESGVTDPEQQWLHAVALYDYIYGQDRSGQAAKQEEAAEEAAEQEQQHTPRQRLLKRGVRKPSRRGSVAPSDSNESTDETLSPGEDLVQQLQADGADFL